MKRKKFSVSTTTYVKSLSRMRIPRPSLPKDYPWKVLQALHKDLASYLDEDENMLLSQIIRDRDFTAYLTLGEHWGLQNYVSLQDPIFSSIAAKYQLASLLKKFQFPTDAEGRKLLATKKFMAAESACAHFNSTDYVGLTKGSEFTAIFLTEMRGFLQKLLGDRCPTQEILTRWSRHGPGANLDTSRDSNVYFKYADWPYSCTRDALPYAHFLIATNKRWLGALEDDYRRRNDIPMHMIIDQQEFWASVFRVVDGNKITFVPKSAVIDRTIAIEPAMNLMLQLGVDGFIRSRLKRFGIDLDNQTKNQILAKLGSLIDDNKSFVTIDLAAASDSIALKLCKLVLPPEWYSYLLKLRSPFGLLGDVKISYEKISSMGCGYTFVLESALFAAVIHAAHVAAGFKDFTFKKDASVFGDDLICRKAALPFVLRGLDLCGFKVNQEKSFTFGPIRESCGTDWLMGRDVRPVSMSTIPKCTSDLFTDRNRLQRYLTLRFGLSQSNVVQTLDKWVPKKLLGIRGPFSNEAFDSYLHSSLEDVRFSLLSQRLNRKSKVRWKYGCWFFPILTRRSKRFMEKTTHFGKTFSYEGGTSFLFRKLMHDLSPEERPKGYGGDVKLASSGSRFSVVRSHSAIEGITISETSEWSSDYSA